MTNFVERTFLLGLGVLTLTREKVASTVEDLVEAGELEARESRQLVDKLVAKGEEEREELRKLIRQEMERARGMKPVSRQEFEDLIERVEGLEQQVRIMAEPEVTQTEPPSEIAE